MASAGTVNIEVRADVNPALESIELALEAIDRNYYLPYTRRERFVLWIADQLGVKASVRRRPRAQGFI